MVAVTYRIGTEPWPGNARPTGPSNVSDLLHSQASPQATQRAQWFDLSQSFRDWISGMWLCSDFDAHLACRSTGAKGSASMETDNVYFGWLVLEERLEKLTRAGVLLVSRGDVTEAL